MQNEAVRKMDLGGAFKREFTEKERKSLAKEGKALPDGSFPIANGSDLDNAIHAVGRAKDYAEAKRHIIARAKDLGMEGRLPDAWKASKSAFPLDPNQSDPRTTDTMSEDPTVDGLKKPKKYTDVMRTYPRARMKTPGPFMQAQPMSVPDIQNSLNKANE